MASQLMIIGDFNIICSGEEKKGGKRFQGTREVLDFRTFLQTNALVELGFYGSEFSWCNNRL